MAESEYKDLRDFLPKAEAGAFVSGSAVSDEIELATMDEIVASLKKVRDPEIPVDVYELGLIYRVNQIKKGSNRGDVEIDMTLTNPACPVAGTLPQNVADSVSSLNGVGRVLIKLVWEPSWSKDMLSSRAKVILGDVL